MNKVLGLIPSTEERRKKERKKEKRRRKEGRKEERTEGRKVQFSEENISQTFISLVISGILK
jgi:hypothetical protein